jgi:prepilin-type processing-associated H-X9-DG protein
VRKRNYWVEGIAAAIALFCLGVFLFPVFAPGHPAWAHTHTQCLSQVKQLSLAMVMYADDYAERLPPTKHWNESIEPYGRSRNLIHCPVGGMGVRYGYAMHHSLSEAKLAMIPEPAERRMLFDSVIRRANATSDESFLPRPGRHRGANMVGFTDGHAKRVYTE